MLQESEQQVPKTHHLTELLSLVNQVEPGAHSLLTDLQILEDYAVSFRYPGMESDENEAKEAYKAEKAVRQYLRQHLGLEI